MQQRIFQLPSLVVGLFKAVAMETHSAVIQYLFVYSQTLASFWVGFQTPSVHLGQLAPLPECPQTKQWAGQAVAFLSLSELRGSKIASTWKPRQEPWGRRRGKASIMQLLCLLWRGLPISRNNCFGYLWLGVNHVCHAHNQLVLIISIISISGGPGREWERQREAEMEVEAVELTD